MYYNAFITHTCAQREREKETKNAAIDSKWNVDILSREKEGGRMIETFLPKIYPADNSLMINSTPKVS